MQLEGLGKLKKQKSFIPWGFEPGISGLWHIALTIALPRAYINIHSETI
jgi:hypothetical protein